MGLIFDNPLYRKTIYVVFWLGLLMLIYTLLRFVFVQYNPLASQGGTTGWNVWIQGLRFDFSAIAMTNLLWIFLYLLPLPSSIDKIKMSMVAMGAVITNMVFFALNLVDVAYYPFTQKRIQSDVFLFFSGEKQTDMLNLLPLFLKEHVALVVLWSFLGWILWLFFKFITQKHFAVKGILMSIFSWIYPILVVVLMIFGVRGGTQLRPLSLINAYDSVSMEEAPYVINATFSVLKTSGKQVLNSDITIPWTEYTSDELGCIDFEGNPQAFKKTNIIFIIVESLSAEYLSKFGGQGKTPFLDSLISKSLIFTQAYANARESVQGIPAVVSSIPAWYDDAFIFSQYSTNKVNSIASLLKPFGYTSAFFHGAKRGSMGFYSFAKHAGFDNYYGREDYDDDKDYDGFWGIWDHKMYDFMVEKLNAIDTPFVATYFTLNPHHPFQIPEPWNSQFSQDQSHQVLRSLRYADAALKSFFEKAKVCPWFENTLFVITADHVGPAVSDMHTALHDYWIPFILFQKDSELHGENPAILNQIDMIPTILDYLQFPQPYFSIGRSAFANNTNNFILNYRQNVLNYTDDTYYAYITEDTIKGIYKYKSDKPLENNLIDNVSDTIKNMISRKIAKRKQLFQYKLVNNSMDTCTILMDVSGHSH